jgi:hypothetical protein
MKKNLSKLLILIPLLFVGGLSYAAYTYIAPTGVPTTNNTDGPLVDTSTDQAKAGGLSVNAFSAAHNSLLNQNAIFAGPVFGGTPDDPTSPVVIGDSTSSLGLNITGSDSITGAYQSDILKTGGGLKPLCADTTGQFYICGTTPPSKTQPVLLSTTFTTVPAGNAVVATLSHWVRDPVTAEIYYTAAGWQVGDPAPIIGFLNDIKNFYTADAIPAGVCVSTTQAIDLGTAYIPAGATQSQPIVLPENCSTDQLTMSIQTYSPHTTSDGLSIKVVN